MGKDSVSHLLFVPCVYELKYFWRHLICLRCAHMFPPMDLFSRGGIQ